MKQIDIRILCDHHAGENQHIPGETLPAIDLGKGPRTLDMCEPCRKDLFERLYALYMESGVIVKKTRNRHGTGKFPCADPDCPRTFPTEQGALTHHTRTHGKAEI